MTGTASIPIATISTAIATTLVALAAIALRWPRLCGTTLVAVWTWSLVTLTVIASSLVLIGFTATDPATNWAQPLRFIAAMSTFCPVMAMLGAKRPQDRAWQFIVASLWFILSLPAFEWLLYDGVREIHPARFWFLVVLVAVGVLNGVATRLWPSTLLYGLGQLALLAPFLPSGQTFRSGDWLDAVGLALLAAASTAETIVSLRVRQAVSGLDRAWLDFRDAFGVVWALRVAERMNAAATMHDWPVRLHWQGFQPAQEVEARAEVPAAVEESLRTLLRRFVSPAWLDERLAESQNQEHKTLIPTNSH